MSSKQRFNHTSGWVPYAEEEKTIERMEKDGWELCGVRGNDKYVWLYWKRPVGTIPSRR